VNTDTYEFVENGERMDVDFKFNLYVSGHILAGNINAWNIDAWNINAYDINARNIKAWNINARNIKALDINAHDINSSDINAWIINAHDISARNINAGDINANNIVYYAVCYVYQSISCKSIRGCRENSKHFALDGEITIKPKEQPKQKVTLELTDEQLEKVKKMLEEMK